MSDLPWPPLEPMPARRPIPAWRLIGPSGRTVCCEIVAIAQVDGLHEVRIGYTDVPDSFVRTQMAYGLGQAIVLAEEWKAMLVERSFTECDGGAL